MGASQWSHFGSYHADPATCFMLLCEKVFREQEYLQLWKPWDEIRHEIEASIDDEIALFGLEECIARTQCVAGARMIIRTHTDVIEFYMMLQPYLLAPPATIEALVRYNEVSGTHSILDYAHEHYRLLPPIQAAQYLQPIVPPLLHHIFGTEHPTRSQIERQYRQLWTHVLEATPYGNSCVVYTEGKATEIFVMGISGD